jgi:type 1 fimbriae regulatory protein FimB/type 1 fimbriae regulatory protein FimE
MPPTKPKNDDVRSREYLTPPEVEKLAKAASKLGRNGHRDSTLILCMFRHGFRVAEACALRRDQVHLDSATMHVKRKKRGKPATHPMVGAEVRALRRLFREEPDSAYVFTSERKGPMSERLVNVVIARAGIEAKLPFPVHAHMLRHACGYKLASEGKDTRAIQDYLGHAQIQHTVRYTQLAAGRFKDFWEE